MKTLITTILLALISMENYAQPEFTFLVKAGDNVVNVEKSSGTPKYENRSSKLMTACG